MPTELPWQLLPSRDPDVPPPVIERANGSFDSKFRRSAYLWVTAIATQVVRTPSLMRQARRPWPDGPLLAVGFAPIPKDLEPPGRSIHSMFLGITLFPPLSDAKETSFIGNFNVSGEEFPILISPAELERHQSSSKPTNPHIGGTQRGTGACWARPRPGGTNPTSLPGEGVLTAAHVGVTASAVAMLSPASPYAVIGYAIDAVVLYPEAIPSDAGALPVTQAVAPGNVDIHIASGTVSATVLSVFAPATYAGLLCPHRFIIDSHYRPGDSGALVTDSGRAAGLYIGAIKSVSGSTQGACQVMNQAIDELDVDLFR